MKLPILTSILFTLVAPAHADFVQDVYAKFPGAVGAKIEPAFDDFYSVVKGSEVLFVKKDLSVLIVGDVVTLVDGKSLTRGLKEANRPRVDVSALDISNAIKFGSGPRQLYVFSDPDCPYCRQLEIELGKLTDTTIYVFPFPIAALHPQARWSAESIWCSKNPAQAWKDYLVNGIKPTPATCENPISKNIAKADSLQLQGTPALVFADGTVIPGAVPAERIAAQFAISQPAL